MTTNLNLLTPRASSARPAPVARAPRAVWTTALAPDGTRRPVMRWVLTAQMTRAVAA